MVVEPKVVHGAGLDAHLLELNQDPWALAVNPETHLAVFMEMVALGQLHWAGRVRTRPRQGK